MHISTAAYVAAVIFAATVVRTTLGFGEALVAVPLLALRLPLAVAAPLAVVVSVIVALVNVIRDWRHIEIRSAAWLTFASLLGIPIGVYLLTHLSDDTAKVVLGVIIAGFGVSAWRGLASPRLMNDDRRWACVAGFVSGVMGGAYGMNGPPLAIYGALRGWSPQRFRATLQSYFLVASLGGLIGYRTQSLVNEALGHYVLAAMPSVVVGIVMGRLIANRMDPAHFVRVVHAGLVMIGFALVLQGVW